MVELKNISNTKVCIAIGKEQGKWYVQTSDLEEDTFLSQTIQEGLDSKEHAMLIAKHYSDKYGMIIADWTSTGFVISIKVLNQLSKIFNVSVPELMKHYQEGNLVEYPCYNDLVRDKLKNYSQSDLIEFIIYPEDLNLNLHHEENYYICEDGVCYYKKF